MCAGWGAPRRGLGLSGPRWGAAPTRCPLRVTPVCGSPPSAVTPVCSHPRGRDRAAGGGGGQRLRLPIPGSHLTQEAACSNYSKSLVMCFNPLLTFRKTGRRRSRCCCCGRRRRGTTAARPLAAARGEGPLHALGFRRCVCEPKFGASRSVSTWGAPWAPRNVCRGSEQEEREAGRAPAPAPAPACGGGRVPPWGPGRTETGCHLSDRRQRPGHER